MREYEKIASKVALFVSVVSLIVQVISKYIFENTLSLGTELLIAMSIGVVSFLIMEWLPKLLLRENSLCGLYLIIYSDAKNNLCSVVNIEYVTERRGYSINIYDCYLKNSVWYSVEGQYPQSLNNIYYDFQPKGLHLISNDENRKSCIFIKFLNKAKAQILRYGFVKPFNKPLEGDLIKLSKSNLCAVYNEGYNNSKFCHMDIRNHELCQAQKRSNCRQNINDILNWVRNDYHYLEIPKRLYYEFVADKEPVGSPPSKNQSNNNATGRSIKNHEGEKNELLKKKSSVIIDESDIKEVVSDSALDLKKDETSHETLINHDSSEYVDEVEIEVSVE